MGDFTLPDENAANRIRVWFAVPTHWDGASNIVLRTIWIADNTGLADIETQVDYRTEVDEALTTTVSAFANTNLTWTTAGRSKVLTTTIAAASLAAGRHFSISFRRGTGDANAGTLFMVGVRINYS